MRSLGTTSTLLGLALMLTVGAIGHSASADGLTGGGASSASSTAAPAIGPTGDVGTTSTAGARRCTVPAHGPTIHAQGNALQAAIDSAPSPSTIVVAPGTYDTGTIKVRSGVWLKGDGVTLNARTTVFDVTQGQEDVWVSGFTVKGGPPAQPCCKTTVSINGGADQIHFVNNTFTDFAGALFIWDANNVYVQCNTFTDGVQAISSRTDGGTVNAQVISDNIISGMSRMGIETGHFGNTVANFHVDRNVLTNIRDIGLSIIGYYRSGTIWGNKISRAGWGIEVGSHGKPFNITVSKNELSNDKWGFGPSSAPGVVFEDNTMTGVSTPFIKDGGYAGDEWIGVNSVNGRQQTGAFGKTYGAKPQTFAPSKRP